MAQFISLFLENKAKFQKSKLKGPKFSSSLISCLSAKSLPFLISPGRQIRQTNRETDRQTYKVTIITISHMHAEG